MTTTKSAIKAGLTLGAKYKGEQYTCEVVEQDGALRFVLPDGRIFKSPSAAGRAITANQVNGYRFWTIPEKPPPGQGRRQRAAHLAVSAQA